MSEKTFIVKFRKKLKDIYPTMYDYKIPDGPFGGVRPCDVLASINGKFIGMEFKVEPNKATKHQLYYLGEITKSGGLAIIITLLKNKNLSIQPIHEGFAHDEIFKPLLEIWR